VTAGLPGSGSPGPAASTGAAVGADLAAHDDVPAGGDAHGAATATTTATAKVAALARGVAAVELAGVTEGAVPDAAAAAAGAADEGIEIRVAVGGAASRFARARAAGGEATSGAGGGVTRGELAGVPTARAAAPPALGRTAPWSRPAAMSTRRRSRSAEPPAGTAVSVEAKTSASILGGETVAHQLARDGDVFPR
jgi:hypothetical protein